MSAVVEAQYSGVCVECEGAIRPGHRIVTLGEGWRHASCEQAPQYCPVCYTQLSVSGACMMCGLVDRGAP